MSSKITAALFWLRYLPAVLRSRIAHRPNLLKILSNIGWLFSDRILRMSVGLFVGVWVARYLGPEQFGLLNYAMAFVALFTPIATLGLNGIVVRDLIKEPETTNATLGTAFLLQIIGGLFAFGLAVFAISFLRSDDSLAKFMVTVLGLVMLLNASEVVKYWFESQVQSKYTVWVLNSVFLAFSSVKIALIIIKAPLMTFVWAAFAEGVLVAVGLLGMYAWRGGSLSAWRGQYQRSKTLLKDSWPLILSGLAIMIYIRIDQIMLGQMVGNEAVGVYSVAVRISEVWYFVPMAIVASVFPSIIEAKKESELIYYQRLQKLYDLMVILALAVALPMTFLSNWLVPLLFGHEYIEAGPVLAIHIWAAIFVFLGVASGKWFLLENLLRQSLYRTILGMLVNICANIILIPKFAAMGAAMGTLLSQVFAAYIFDLFDKRTRRSFFLKTSSLLPFLVKIRSRGYQ